MSKTKRLLSVTLAIAMIILSAFSAFAEDTETVVETVGAMIVAADSIETDDTTFDVNVKISFNEVVTGPHNIITLTCDKFNLTNVELGDVVYNYTGSEKVNGETVQLPQGKVTIAEDGVKNANWATGKVLIEAPVDGTAPLVSEINLTATFTLKADVALVAGETLNIAVANDDMADASETKLSISSGASVVTVHGAGTTYCHDETNHWHACVVEGCTEHKYDVAAHTMSDYEVNADDTTKETATCTGDCGYSHTKDVEANVGELSATTYIGGSTTQFQLKCNIQMSYTGDTSKVVETGVLALDSSKYTSGTEITVDTDKVIVITYDTTGFNSGLWNAFIAGFSFTKIDTDFYFVPYIVLSDDTVVYCNNTEGNFIAYSFADYLVKNYSTNTRAKAYIDAYYNYSDTKLHDDAVKYEYLDTSVTYTPSYEEVTYVNPKGDTGLTASTYIGGSTTQFQLKCNIQMSYTGDTSKVVETGVLALDSSKYTSGTEITVDTDKVIVITYDTTGFNSSLWNAFIAGFSFNKLATDFIFVPYVELDDGSMVYGNYSAYSFADYLITKSLNGGNAGAARANAYLSAHAAMTGVSLYN